MSDMVMVLSTEDNRIRVDCYESIEEARERLSEIEGSAIMCGPLRTVGEEEHVEVRDTTFLFHACQRFTPDQIARSDARSPSLGMRLLDNVSILGKP